MKNLEQILERNNVHPTAMRLLVLKFLFNRNGVAVSLSDIEDNFYNSDRTTLYRTLKTFASSDIVHRIDDGTGITKYALCEEGCHCTVENDLHLHFHCNKCGETVCFPKNKIPKITLDEGFISEEINFVIKGICNKCEK